MCPYAESLKNNSTVIIARRAYGFAAHKQVSEEEVVKILQLYDYYSDSGNRITSNSTITMAGVKKTSQPAIRGKTDVKKI